MSAAIPDDREACAVLVWRKAVRDAGEGLLFVRSDLLVLLALSIRMNSDGGGAFPSIATQASELGLSDGQVSRSLKLAREHGFLHLEQRGHRKGNGKTVSNKYRATIPRSLSLPDVEDMLSDDETEPQPRSGVRLSGASTAHGQGLNLTSGGSQPDVSDPLGSPVVEGDHIEGGLASLVAKAAHEVPAMLAALSAAHPPSEVERATTAVISEGTRYTFTSDLRRVLEQRIAAAPAPLHRFGSQPPKPPPPSEGTYHDSVDDRRSLLATRREARA